MPDIAEPAQPAAQVPSKGGTELAAPQSGRSVGHSAAAFGDKVFDIPAPESESMIEPPSVPDDLGWYAVTSVQGFHRSSVPNGCQLENTAPTGLSPSNKGARTPNASLQVGSTDTAFSRGSCGHPQLIPARTPSSQGDPSATSSGASLRHLEDCDEHALSEGPRTDVRIRIASARTTGQFAPNATP